MKRRDFLETSGFGFASLLAAGFGETAARAFAPSRASLKASEIRADVVILGGGLGGCAAALAALRHGETVVMTEITDWVGGQLTQQAVPPDEHPWIEKFGANASYFDLRRRIRGYYREHYPLTQEAASRPFLNPGNGNVSKICHEPRASLAAITSMLAPYASAGKLTLLLEHKPTSATVQGDFVKSVTVRDLKTGDDRVLLAPYFLDATEMGDVLPMAGVEYVTGFEAKSETGDLKAPEKAQPDNQQAFTCCFAMDYIAGADHTIDKPAEYGFWRDYVPKMTPAWPGKLLGDATDPFTMKTRKFAFDPTGAGAGFWVYRRIIDAKNFREGLFPGGMTLVNWPQNDYWLGNLIGVTDEEAAKHVVRAKQLSLSLLYWLQTEFPRADGKMGYKGLRLRPDVVGTNDGMAKYPYIRESRRIRAEFTVLEAHVGTEARRKALGKEDVTAENFADSVGVGSYRIDLHPSSGGDNYIDVSSLPFQIPLGALIPRRVENLLPACKNLGVTHITNGCYRLHPVEWGIGEAAGALVSFSLGRKTTPRAVRNSPKLLKDFQGFLTNQGVEIEWPRLTPR
jgi:hypothetical protein